MTAPAGVALFAPRWSAPAPTGMGRHSHGLASGLAEVLHGTTEPGAPGRREAADGTGPDGRRWAITATSAAEGDVGERLPGGLGWRPLPGPRKARLAWWRLLGRPAIDRPLGRPDLVHSLLPFVPVPTASRFVQTVPDTIPLAHPEWHRGVERWGFAGGFAALPRADAVVVSTRHVGDEVAALGVAPDRIAVVPLGVDDGFFADVDAGIVAATARSHGVAVGRYVVAVGAVSARKNAGVLLDALAERPATGEVELLLVGPVHDEVVTDAERRGLADRVRATGFVPDADLHALLRGARGLVHPSTAEGFGLTPLEAMAAGTPALVAGGTATTEVVGDAAVVLDPDDPSAWAAAIERLAGDDAWAASLVAAGRVRAARYRWRATAEGHLAVWAAVLDGRPVPGPQPPSASR